jgi:hypothetical protein
MSLDGACFLFLYYTFASCNAPFAAGTVTLVNIQETKKRRQQVLVCCTKSDKNHTVKKCLEELRKTDRNSEEKNGIKI